MSGAGLSRREFLRSTGWIAGGLTILTSCRIVPVLPTFGQPSPSESLAWVQMRAGGRVTFLCPRTEMGQGIATGLTQVVAEELGLANSAIDCVYPRSDQIAPTAMTVGSQSVEKFFEPLARASASLREELRRRASTRGGIRLEDLKLADGGFAGPDGARVSYAELIDAAEATLSPAEPAGEIELLSLRPLAERSAVGRLREPVHIDSLVTGAEIYSRDVRLPELAFGELAAPPQIGAVLLAFDAAAASAVAGVLAVVEGPANQVGVVAETPMAASRGVAALACRWQALDASELAEVQQSLDIDRAIAEGALDHTPVDEGDLDAGRARAASHLDVRYDTPMVAHACIEPRAGVANVRDGRCEVWTGSQDPWFVRAHVARALGLSKQDVVVHNQRVGGAFGGRMLDQPAIEAAWLSAASKRPVKVQWTREAEMAQNYVGPQFSHRIRAGTDADGGISYWQHQMVGSPILTSSMMLPEYLHWAANIPADPGTWRGTDLPYRAPNRRIDFADVRVPMPTGAWRGLGAAPNTFAVECAIDELAQGAGVDPLEFRLRNAQSERLKHVLERAREFADWQRQRAGGARLGVASTAYKGLTFVAIVARVTLEGDAPRVDRLWCVQDCGLVVSPDQVRAQIEGNLVWGVSMALREEFRLEGGTPATRNFDSYAIARNEDVPEIEIELVESELPPSGSGEAAFAPAAAAIVNAISLARGERLRRLPLLRSA